LDRRTFLVASAGAAAAAVPVALSFVPTGATEDGDASTALGESIIDESLPLSDKRQLVSELVNDEYYGMEWHERFT